MLHETTNNPLHEPLLPILQMLLAIQAPIAGTVLDLGAGSGDKMALIAAACGPQARILALDTDQAALRANPTSLRIAGAAESLPLRNASCSRAYCIAAFGLFDDQQQVASELRRVLQADATVLIVTATQCWAQITHWPAATLPALIEAYHTSSPLDADKDLAIQLSEGLADGWSRIQVRAFLLDVDNPQIGELSLLDWPRLDALIGARLPAEIRKQCAACEAEIELCPVVLAAFVSV